MEQPQLDPPGGGEPLESLYQEPHSWRERRLGLMMRRPDAPASAPPAAREAA